MKNEQIIKLSEIINSSGNIVFFGGAGVSTESGIPDFRGTDGLYSKRYKFPPEKMLSHSFFVENPAEFFAFYRDKMLFPDIKPNKAHYALARLEKSGKLKAIVTQNIDGLHQKAGSSNVLELHGSVYRNYCERCRKFYGIEKILEESGVPRCDCGGIVKPDVVLYEEGLNRDIITKAINFISNADALIVGGTSLVVYPAASLARYYNGDKLVLINRSETSLDSIAKLVISDKIGEVLYSVTDKYLSEDG